MGIIHAKMDSNFKKNIKIGTRKSPLALWQAEDVAKSLKSAGYNTELVLFETIGDVKMDTNIAKIGSKGIFTAELETALRQDSIDIAVHSAKDMPSEDSPELKILAFTERESAHDVLISHQPLQISSENIVRASWQIGTSSTRRVAQLRHWWPNVRTAPMRGNLQTRIRKMKEGQCDALMLAYAGVHRLGLDDMIVMHCPTDTFTPAAGQGSMAIQIAKTMPQSLQNALKNILNHPETELLVAAERFFLSRMNAGCSMPVFINVEVKEGSSICLMRGGVSALDGQKYIAEEIICSKERILQNADILATGILNKGGRTILKEIKERINS